MGMVQPQTILNDKDIAQDLLTSEKYVTTLVATGTLEASNPQVRNTMSQIHSEMESTSRRVFDYLNARGWYNPRIADPQSINDLRRSVDEANQDIQRSFTGGGVTGQAGNVRSGVGQQVGVGSGGGYQSSTYGTHGTGSFGGGYQAGGYGTGYGQSLPSWAYREIGRGGQHGSYGGGYQAGGYGTGYGQNLPSWAYSEPPRREDRGGYYGTGGFGGGYQAGGYGTYGTGGYGGGYQAGGYGTGYGQNLPSWAYSEPPRREDRGG
ncbi:MAG: spore coat protein, partial [bacterium]|nr:spore coat protein [bacterium]